MSEKVFGKFGGKCAYCGFELQKKWHIDHLIPVIRCLTTGKPTRKEHDHTDNLMPSCPSCNMDKSSMSLETWRSVIANKINVLNRDVTAYKFAKRYGLVQETDKPVIFHFEKDMKNKFNHKELNKDGSINYHYFLTRIEKEGIDKEILGKMVDTLKQRNLETRNEFDNKDWVIELMAFQKILTNWETKESLVTEVCLSEIN